MITKESRVLITGGSGFLGRHVHAELNRRSYSDLAVVGHRSRCDQGKWATAVEGPPLGWNLTEPTTTLAMLQAVKPDCVINLAAIVGGIGANIKSPAVFYYDNAMINTNIIHCSHLAGIKKLVNVGTICSYPSVTPLPFNEDDLWEGFPEVSNSPYGIAKKAALVQQIAYKQQYGLNSIYLIPVNLYGPGDNFDDDTSHVIPALIKKMLAAKKSGQPCVIWGTGAATREFLYVADCARAIVDAMESHNDVSPINIGTGKEIRISDLVQKIATMVGFTGDILWDTSKPDGQMRRVLDVTRAKNVLGFEASVNLDDGLKSTIEWYVQQCQSE